jgi:hypothetical protein
VATAGTLAQAAPLPEAKAMGKASRNKRERAAVVPTTHEPDKPHDWPRGHVRVDLTGDDAGECIVVTIHDVRHFLHSTTAQALNEGLEERIVEWDTYAKSRGAVGVLPTKTEERAHHQSSHFDSKQVAAELTQARALTKPMVRGALDALDSEGSLTRGHLPFLGFIERAQAFHEGVLSMVEGGNPLAAATLLRSFAENLAVVFYLEKHPAEFEKLQPGAEQGLPIGKVVAAAQKALPGFKGVYDHLSSMAHPSGAGAFQTLNIEGDRTFTWQSSPTFRSADEARTILRWLEEIRGLTAQVTEQTAAQFRSAATKRTSS